MRIPLIPIVIFTLGISSLCFGQKFEDGWKQIKPLKSDRSFVDNVLGVAELDQNDGFYRYVTPDSVIRVAYSIGPCLEDNSYPGNNRGEYDVAEWTVLHYEIFFRNPVPIKEFSVNLKRYELVRIQVGTSLYYSEYVSKNRSLTEKSGISIMLLGDGAWPLPKEQVVRLTYNGDEEDLKAATCPK